MLIGLTNYIDMLFSSFSNNDRSEKLYVYYISRIDASRSYVLSNIFAPQRKVNLLCQSSYNSNYHSRLKEKNSFFSLYERIELCLNTWAYFYLSCIYCRIKSKIYIRFCSFFPTYYWGVTIYFFSLVFVFVCFFVVVVSFYWPSL